MAASDIRQVRSFNRLVTERVGALEDRYLSGGRPLGEARVLWEVGDGVDVRELRARLGLDSGYLSRLLRALEADGAIVVERSDVDRRVRTVRLTAAGRRERALLDGRSDELARSLLAPLDERQRERLVRAMEEVERLLTAGLVELVEVDPAAPEAQHCLQAYFAELDRRFETGFDVARASDPALLARLRPPAGLFLVARLRGEPVGCGGLHLLGGTAELKRMWLADDVRGLGLGRRLLGELEGRAAAAGARTIRLETNRALGEALALYRSAGYREVEPFNDLPFAHHWLAKRLRAPRGGSRTRRRRVR